MLLWVGLLHHLAQAPHLLSFGVSSPPASSTHPHGLAGNWSGCGGAKGVAAYWMHARKWSAIRKGAWRWPGGV